MPDHVHLLVEGLAQQSDLRHFIRIGKQRSACRNARQMTGRLWQEGYHDRVLRPEEDVRQYARYVLQNPIRAGLVEDVSNYKHAGSDVWPVAEILGEVPEPKGPAYVLSAIGVVRGADL